MDDTPGSGSEPLGKADRHRLTSETETAIGALLLGRVGITLDDQLEAGRQTMGQLTGNSPVKGAFYGVDQDESYAAAVHAVYSMLIRAEQSEHPEEVVPTAVELKIVADSRVRLAQSAPFGPPPDDEHIRLPAVLKAVLREMRDAEGTDVVEGHARARGVVLPSDRDAAPEKTL